MIRKKKPVDDSAISIRTSYTAQIIQSKLAFDLWQGCAVKS